MKDLNITCPHCGNVRNIYDWDKNTLREFEELGTTITKCVKKGILDSSSYITFCCPTYGCYVLGKDILKANSQIIKEE